MKKIWCALIGVVMLFAFVQSNAQDADTHLVDEVAEELVFPADDYERGTPRRSWEALMEAAETGDFETAAEYLDLRNLRGEADDFTGAQLARRLYVIVKRATWVDIDELIDHPLGRTNDNLPDYRDSLGRIQDGDKEIQLLLQKVPRGDGVYIWKISNSTVSLIPKLYEVHGYPEVIEDFRRSLPNVTFLGFELFKWILVSVTGLFAYAVIFSLTFLIRRVSGDQLEPTRSQIINFARLPFGIWVVIMSVNTAASMLGRGPTTEAIQRLSPIPILVTAWMIFAGLNLFRDTLSNRFQDQARPGAVVLLQPGTTTMKLLVGVVAILIYLNNLGINITTVLAGLGVGGIAVALALQKPLEDILGAITLYTQQPVRVGDFCRIGDDTGTVEEIGLRTTRLRTLANTLIAIPNAALATAAIDNISARKKILYRPVLRLRYDTSPEQIQTILSGIRTAFSSHNRVLQDNHRVRFKEIAEDALSVEAFAYIDTTVWAEYLELAEGLNLQILDIVAKAGTTLSLPARTLHIEQSEGAVSLQ